MPVKLYVRECLEPSGELEPLPSLWSSLVAIFAAATQGEAEIAPIDTRNTCIREAIALLTSLGYRTEKLSSEKLLVKKENTPFRPLTHRLNLGCGLLVAELAAAFFAVQAPPRSQLILRATGSEYLLSLNTREFREVIASLGARIWGGGSAQRYLVVEKLAAPPPRILRLGARNATLVASALLALISVSESVTIRVLLPSLYALSRLDAAIDIISKLGYDVEQANGLIRVEKISDTGIGELKPRSGVAETLSIAMYASLCGRAEIALDVKSFGQKEREELLYLLGIIGYDIEQRDEQFLLSYSAPRNFVYTVDNIPELIAPLAAQASIVGGSGIAGIAPSLLEGLVSKTLERVGAELGAEIYLEGDERVRVIKPVARLARNQYTCSGLDPASCFLILSASLARRRRLLLLDADKVIGLIPFGPERLQELGIDMIVQK